MRNETLLEREKMSLPLVKDVAPVEFTIKIDGTQLSLQKEVYPNAVEIEKKLRELIKLFHLDLVCSFCAELVPDGEKFEMEVFGEFKEYKIFRKEENG